MDEPLIPPHGGYRDLKAYKMAEIVRDGTVTFCANYLDRRSRTNDQMVQAARSGKQNIAEGSVASGTSKKIELKLIGIARASLEELLVDYSDFLRQNEMEQWSKDHEKAQFIRRLCYKPECSFQLYRPYVETKGPANAANTMICLVHQTNFLLDQVLRQLEKAFLEQGGFTERLYQHRFKKRGTS